jgi:hypothetical protein
LCAAADFGVRFSYVAISFFKASCISFSVMGERLAVEL